MKRFFVLTLLLCALHIAFIPLSAQEICGTDALLEQRLQELGLTYEQYFEHMGQSLGNLSDVERSLQDNRVYTIPVVVHVLHYGGEVGAAGSLNISTARIDAQIEVLNKAFAESHADVGNIPAAFQEDRAGDIKVRFALAFKDPEGNYTNGVTRTQISRPQQGEFVNLSSMPGYKAPWDQSKYLNIWLPPAAQTDGLTGAAQIPPTVLADDAELTDDDGVMVITESLPGGVAPNDEGDVLVHEVGHYFGLLHTFSTRCNVDDGCDDTPPQDGFTRPETSCDLRGNSCEEPDMIENYMDYSADACLLMFTQCQRDIMRGYLASDPYRSALWKNVKDRVPILHTSGAISHAGVRMYPNPVAGTLYFSGLSTTHHYQYKIYTATGLLMHSGVLRKNNIIDTRILHRGQYIVSLHTQVGAEAIRSALIVK